MNATDTDIQWFIARDGKQHGPVTDVELKKLVELTHLKPADLVWRQGFSDWRSAASVFPTLAEPTKPAAPAAPVAAPVSAPTPAPTAAAAPAPASGLTPGIAKPAPMSHTPISHPMAPGAAKLAAGTSAVGSNSPHTLGAIGDTRPEQAGTRPLGNATVRAADPFPAPGPGPRPSNADPRKPAEFSAPPREEASLRSGGRKKVLVALGLVAMTGFGAWLMSQYKDEILGYVQTQGSGSNGTATANLIPPSGTNQPAAAEAAPVPAAAPTADDIDRKLQSRTMWVSVKQEFPDWYQTRIAEVARLSAEHKEPAAISHYLISEFVSLRRENAQHALAASTPRHKELAAAFLANLSQLSKESGDGCYDFISKGESSAAIVSRMDDPAKSAEIEAQVVAIVAAISEGRKQPSQHAPPVKTDYDVLAGELGRLGWTQADMQLFANPKELAKAPRDRVCNMLKDWFTAHLAIQDPSTQERLLFETLKPVISG
ncbi:DUF4339 domain-containing protein [Hyphomicrobium sp.]|uniref:DUF4339 domain-containing protein n=1 Tax=Hyphomicrobium sp. TaxID=82 RepID=UPI002E31FA89|nr:DUF4339 domain-containing protein [Hyphomicrobium sp.]HEX2842001.1 DUF4339 domain-containing protein [Hyphomicrobium sp.]